MAALEDYSGPFPPFDNTRNNTLNPRNPLVAMLFGWLGGCIKAVIGELERAEEERKRSTEAKALQSEADRISKVLNEDFQQLQLELEHARRNARIVGNPVEIAGIGRPNPEAEQLLPDAEGTIPIASIAAGPEHGDGKRGHEPAGIGDLPRPGSGMIPGEGKGAPRDPIQRPRRTSGFNLEFLHETEEAPRSRYSEETKTIVINLDHPQLQAARRHGGQDSTLFRQMSYEIAFVEYALALGNEHLRRDPQVSGEDTLNEIRDVMNRITRRLGNIFR